MFAKGMFENNIITKLCKSVEGRELFSTLFELPVLFIRRYIFICQYIY